MVASWLEGDGEDEVLTTNFRQNTVTIEGLSTGTYYAGIRAFNSDDLQVVEYSPFDSPNTVSVSFSVSDDLQAPYFIQHGAPYDDTAAAQNNSIAATFPYDGEIQVLFKRAIDPPDYSETTELTYFCFWSSEEFDAGDIAFDVNGDPDVTDIAWESKTLAYSEHKTPIFETETYSIWIEEDYDSSALAPGTDYFVYVMARDTAGNVSENIEVATAQIVGVSAESDLLASVSLAVGKTVGSIVADNDNVYVLFPAGNSGSHNEYVDLTYKELDSGDLPASFTDSTVTSGFTNPPVRSGSFGTGSQTYMDFVRNENGQSVAAGSGRKKAVISWAGWENLGFEAFACSSGFDGGSWFVDHSQNDAEINSSNLAVNSPSPAITTYQYIASGSVSSVYQMPWVYGELIAGGWLEDKTRFNTTTQISSLSTWPMSPTDLSNALPYWTDFYNPTSVDVITRTLGFDLEHFIDSSGEGDPVIYGTETTVEEFLTDVNDFGNAYFWLTNSGDPAGVNNNEYMAAELWYGANPATSPSGPVNLLTALPDPGSATSPSMGPNSLEAVRTETSGSSYVYVAYCNSDLDELTSSDNMGLRVAYASHSVSGGIGTFTSPTDATGMVDDTYFFIGQGLVGNNDQVDLRVKPDSRISDDVYKGLGCAYVAPDGSLQIAETVENSGDWEWHILDVGPNTTAPLDQGRIDWLKLVYYHPVGEIRAVPYILYSKRVVNSGVVSSEIRLWRPGGF